MPYDKTSGLMTAPLNTYDIAIAVSKPSGADVGTLCTAEGINKWAKNKPVRYAKFRDLTEEERIGTPADKTDGYYYGVKLGSHNGQGASIMNLHDVRFDYLRPSDHFRMNDFIGYSKFAIPTVYCTLPDAGYNDVERGLVFDIDYTTTNTTGLDISEAVRAATGYAITNCWPCLLLSNTARTANYVCVLRDNNGAASMVKASNRTYYADLRNVGGVKLSSGSYQITPFLYNPAGLSDSFKTDGSWFAITSDQPWAGRNPIAIPSDYANDCGKVIAVSPSDTRPAMRIQGVSVVGTTLNIIAVVDGTGNAAQCNCTPTITDGNRRYQAAAKGSVLTGGAAAFSYDMLTDFEIMKGVATTYTLECMFETYNGGDLDKRSSFSTKEFTY